MLVLAVVVAAILIAVVGLVIWAFNRLVKARNYVRDGWAGIDVQLRKRADLVPNLVAVVDGYRVHERDALEQVVGARARVEAASGPDAAGRADASLETSLVKLYAVAEAYPDLKADKAFRELQTRLTDLEDDIASARRYYNALVRRYNDVQQTFPAALVARGLGHREAEYFQIDQEAAGPTATGF